MAKVMDKAAKFISMSNRRRQGASVPKSQPRNMGKIAGQLQTAMVARVIRGPDQGAG